MTGKIPHRRRREKKTDYKNRYALLKSGKCRLIVRRHHNNIKLQAIEWKEDGDHTLAQVNSDDLEEYGWKGHSGNIPAAYLSGLLLGYKAKEEGIEEMILDIGLQITSSESSIYASVKGVNDAGVDVPVGQEMLPDEDRIKGKHIEYIAENMDQSTKEDQFSSIIDSGLDPENITENFEEVKENIIDEKGE